MGKAKLVCHHCSRPHTSRLGGDLTCSNDCLDRYDKFRAKSEDALRTEGFTQHADVPNLWTKGGVHISIDQVIREGFKQTLARHGKAVKAVRYRQTDRNA